MKVQYVEIHTFFTLSICLTFSLSKGLKEYISNPFFEKHEALNDSEFERFLNSEVSLVSCQLEKAKLENVPKILAFHRDLIGEGSHRHLVTSITLELELPEHSCKAIVVERLPSGVFADPFELQHLVLRRVWNDAAVFGDTNLELPSFRSNRSLVEVHMEISPAMNFRDHKQAEIKIELPLHARYQPLGLGFSRVEFGWPDVFLQCRVKGNLQEKNCLFVPTDQSSKSEDARIIWEVPCGNKEHAEIVSVVTFASAVLSASLIVLTSVFYSNLAIGGHSKLS